MSLKHDLSTDPNAMISPVISSASIKIVWSAKMYWESLIAKGMLEKHVHTVPADSLTWWPKTLTHWGRVTHICVGKLTIIGSDNDLSPGRRQAIIWTNAGILLIGSLGTNFSEILIEIQTISFRKMHLKMSSAKWRPFCLGFNELSTNHYSDVTWVSYCLFTILVRWITKENQSWVSLPFVRGTTSNWWIPSQKEQQYGKCVFMFFVRGNHKWLVVFPQKNASNVECVFMLPHHHARCIFNGMHCICLPY